MMNLDISFLVKPMLMLYIHIGFVLKPMLMQYIKIGFLAKPMSTFMMHTLILHVPQFEKIYGLIS